MSHIGRQIRQMREFRGLSQGELASLCAIPQSLISRAEGRNNLTIRTLQRFAKAMKARLVVQFVPEESASECSSLTGQPSTENFSHGNGGMQTHGREIKRLAQSIAEGLSRVSKDTRQSH